MRHKIKTEKFEGPISTLYEMIEERKLSISEFSLVDITEDFINHVRALDGLDKDETTHFISIASVLILLKSKTLIPELELTEEEDRDILILENQLAAFALLKERVKFLEKTWSKKILLNASVQHKSAGQIFVPSPQMDLKFFHSYVLERLQELVPKEDEKKEVRVHKTLKIEDALSHVRTLIKRIKNLNFKNLNNASGDLGDERLREKNKRNVVILFLAVLELVKIGEIDVTQEENFSDILITGE
jgi:segregation and condensation protein A